MGIDLGLLAARAAFWWERLEERFVPEGEEPAVEPIERWRRTVATGSRGNLARRLAWDGLDLPTVGPLLGSVRPAEPVAGVVGAGEVNPEAPPPWVETLGEILGDLRPGSRSPDRAGDAAAGLADTSSSTPPDVEPGVLDPADPLPFEDLLCPVLGTARRLAATRIPARRAELLTARAWSALERSLLRRLSELSVRVLQAELARARPAGLTFLDKAIPQRGGSGATDRYRALVERHLASGLVDLVEEYPVLGRLLATAVRQWLATTEELVARLERDLPVLEETFGEGRPLGAVVDLRPALSDRHRGGRSTAILAFASGVEVVYKPKDLAPDRLFVELLAWCNRRRADGTGLLDFHLTRILPRDGYGWVECIERLPCPAPEAARRFYLRAGQLLAVVYAVRGTDCHMENLIARGEHPVLVDHETLFFPEPRLLTGEPQVKVAERLGSSVLTTGFLPQWELDQDNLAFDTSGFGGEEAVDHPWRTPCWLHVNTDDMRRGYRPVPAHEEHRPRLGDAVLSAVDYAAEIETGFRAAYRLLMGHREELLAPGGPLAELATISVRFLFRRTAVYARLLERVTGPELLRDGVAFSTELDLLSRAFLIEEERSHAWPVLGAELRSMAAMDVPYFTHRADGRGLSWSDGSWSDGELPSYFERGSLERVRDSLAGLGEEDLSWQAQVLRTAFFTRRARKSADRALSREGARTESRAGDGGAESGELAEPLSDAEALAEAERLAGEIHATAIRENDGTASWIGLSFAPRVERYLLESLDPQLYHGLGGIALFLAALHRVGGGERHRELALTAVRRVVREAEEPELIERVARTLGLGGIAGIGSVVYALVKVAALLEAPELVRAAALIARTITEERIREDRRFDVMSGSAGALMALLVLDRAGGAEWFPELTARAAACGDHLVRRRVETDAGRAWQGAFARPLTGFSHGAGGIALALLGLYRVTGEERFLEAATEGIAYEQSLFSERAGNWPDLRDPDTRDPTGFMTSWCHGAPGIALARAAGLEVLDTPAVRRDVAVAVETTLRFGRGTIDTVCCGTCGRVEVLHTVAALTALPAGSTGSAGSTGWGPDASGERLRTAARRLAAGTVARARQAGGYRALPNLPLAATPPGFFMGLAGVGYTLLRLVDPDLPSVLTLS